jgi:TRAP-type C4-dicarboxylate transport system permease large subunit
MAVANISMGSMMRYMKWFFLALIVVLLLTTYVPAVTMFLIN